jgi:Capsule assembly protein Wzi
MRTRDFNNIALAAILSLSPAALYAQVRALTTIGSVAEDRLRLAQLSDSASTSGFLIRTAGSLSDSRLNSPPSSIFHLPSSFKAFILAPELAVAWNSRIPLSLNDGAMWAGRGASTLVRAGAGFSSKYFTLIVAPEFTYSQNLDFEVMPGTAPGRSAWSSPWHTGSQSADLPLRFGDKPWQLVSPGQSSLTLNAGAIALGVSSENQWWGPGVRNALLMSNQAEGVPHMFVRSARPIVTRAGDFEWRLIGGALTESIYFDTAAANNTRSLSGFVVTFRPASARDLTLGLARIVVAPTAGPGTAMQGAFNSLTKWHPSGTPVTRADSLEGDQMMSLFGRWIFPKDHFEFYFEWAKSALPRSLRDLVIAPQDAQGYTLGLQWAIPVREIKAAVRVQAEATNVEQSLVFANYPVPDYYTGSTTAQGFTQRGQLLGASVGPGGQSQWFATDYMARDWSLGIMLQRIRWEDNALERQPLANFFRHDVTLMAGMRGTLRTRAYDFSASIAANPRYSYLFQDGFASPGGRRTIDVSNLTITFGASPR